MQTETLPVYHQTIHDLPLSKFIDCIVDGNLSALIISGFPTPEQLEAAWEVINSQYSEMIGTKEYKMYKILYCEVAKLKIELFQVNYLAARGNDLGEKEGVLRIFYNEYLADELNKILRTDCRFNWNDQKSYNAALDKCVNRGKALKIQYDLKNMNFKAIEKKNNSKPGVKMDRQYFTGYLIELSDFAKFRIDSSIFMDEYCLRIKKYIEYHEFIKKKT